MSLAKSAIVLFSMLLIVIDFAAGSNTPTVNTITYNGFRSANLSLDGLAQINSNGLLRLTDATKQGMGHAFYPNPFTFKNSSLSNASIASSFSTTFIFAIDPQYTTLGGHGIVFVLSPTRGLPGAVPSTYLGLFNETNNGKPTNHVVGVELDTILSPEFDDINDNHVGIDINNLHSEISAPACYYLDNSSHNCQNLTLISGKPMQVWIEYDASQKLMDATIAPINIQKPKKPLLSLSRDLSPVIKENMYIGFSSSTGSLITYHYILGWSFAMNGPAPELVISQLPKLPRTQPKRHPSS